ncbi:MAG: TatD family hydrolase [Candidatus Dojkabacteria bacterium]|nr:TatD family hydrolase [Candidatus Dojkabacteria bacterium]
MKLNTFFDSHAHIFAYTDKHKRDIQDLCNKNNITEVWNMSLGPENFNTVVNDYYDYNKFYKPFIGYSHDYVINLFIKHVNKEIRFFEKLAYNNIEVLELFIKYQMYKKVDFFGIGEIGIDMHHPKRCLKLVSEIQACLQVQKIFFSLQLELAKKYNLVVSVHSRKAEIEIINILQNLNYFENVIMHSFTGSKELFVNLHLKGSFIGVNAICTYRSGKPIIEAIREILIKNKINKISTISDLYLNKILLETDSPYLCINTSENINTPITLLDIFHYLVDTL